jgi:hypothetical protein
MAIEKKYITLSDLDDNQIVSTKLYVDQYNQTELEKAVDITVTELIKALPDANLDLVPKPIYDLEVSNSIDLQRKVDILTQNVSDLNSRIQSLLADSSSLYITNDNLNIQVASLENSLAQSATTTYELRLNLTTSLTKALNEATERTALEAENSGLNAQKNALIKQIDTLNNLLAQANASLQVASQQLSAKAQAVAAGGVSTGELATLVWEKGDPSKNGGNGVAIDLNLIAKGAKVEGPPQYAAGWSSNYVDIVAGPKDIIATISQTFFRIESPLNLKANETKRVTFDKPIQSKVPSGTRGWTGLGKSQRDYEETLKITVKDIDPAGKTEDKTFRVKVHSYE